MKITGTAKGVDYEMGWNDCHDAMEEMRNRLINDRNKFEQQLGNLLARIHRDGGHYIAKHGWDKAAEDADAKCVAWIAEHDA